MRFAILLVALLLLVMGGADAKYSPALEMADNISMNTYAAPNYITGLPNPSLPTDAAPWKSVNAANNSLKARFVFFEDYGAIGNGIVDDSAAIQAAIDANDDTGTPIHAMPGKDYLINSDLQMRTYTDIDLSGATIVLGTNIGFNFSNVWQCKIRNGYIYIKAANQIGIKIDDGCADLYFENLFLIDDSSSAANTKGIYINDTYISEFISVRVIDFAIDLDIIGGSHLNFVACSFRTGRTTNLNLSNCDNIEFVSCDIEGGVRLLNAGTSTNAVFSGTWFEDSDDAWIELSSGTIIFDHCFINGAWTTIQTTPNVSFLDCIFNDNGLSSDDYPQILRETNDAARLTLHNNFMTNPTGCIFVVTWYYSEESWFPKTVPDILDISGDQRIHDTFTDSVRAVGYAPEKIWTIDGHTKTWGTAAPTTGTWARGDQVWRTDATSGATPGWVCTTAGTPGTWRAMANLASS